MGEWENNPAEKPGAIIFRPDSDPLLVYDSTIEATIDTRNGDRFVFRHGHGSQFAFFNVDSDGIKAVSGNINSRGLSKSRTMSMYEIVRATVGYDKSPDLLPQEYDLTRVASFLKAHLQGMQPGLPIEIIVVDNRVHYARSKA
jgi:hypothetical protein